MSFINKNRLPSVKNTLIENIKITSYVFQPSRIILRLIFETY